jgi:gliding motility-associated lipoprotein GldH
MLSFVRFLKVILLAGFLSLSFSSCDSKRFYEENKVLEKSTWSSSDKAIFDVDITDNKAAYNYYINVRNTGDYQFSNLYLFLQTTFPDGRVARDTIECRLADYNGKWLGSGITSIKFNRLLFQKGVKFPQKGKYIFELEQAMRIKDLKGISDIGIRLEKE